MNTLEQFRGGRTISVTTYNRTGRGIATPVWFTTSDHELFIMTAPDSGKVTRILDNNRVAVASCGRQGRIATGATQFEGTARLLDNHHTKRVQDLMARKYLSVRVATLLEKLTCRRHAWSAIAISITSPRP
jgi:uncharacterized protein